MSTARRRPSYTPCYFCHFHDDAVVLMTTGGRRCSPWRQTHMAGLRRRRRTLGPSSAPAGSGRPGAPLPRATSAAPCACGASPPSCGSQVSACDLSSNTWSSCLMKHCFPTHMQLLSFTTCCRYSDALMTATATLMPLLMIPSRLPGGLGSAGTRMSGAVRHKECFSSPPHVLLLVTVPEEEDAPLPPPAALLRHELRVTRAGVDCEPVRLRCSLCACDPWIRQSASCIAWKCCSCRCIGTARSQKPTWQQKSCRETGSPFVARS